MGCRFVLSEEVCGNDSSGQACEGGASHDTSSVRRRVGLVHLLSDRAQGRRGLSLELSTAGCRAQVSSIQTQNPEKLMFGLQAVPLMGSLNHSLGS